MADARQAAPVKIQINTAEIPDAIRDRLAVATMEFIRNIMKQPGGREALEERMAAKL